MTQLVLFHVFQIRLSHSSTTPPCLLISHPSAAKAFTVALPVMESTTIAVLGCALGYLVYAVILSTAAVIVRQETGVVIDVAAFHPVLAWTPLGMVAMGFVAGILPAIKAYSTDVISHL